MINGPPALVDTNVLIHSYDTSSDHCGDCKILLDNGEDGLCDLILTPQVLAEFFTVVTNSQKTPNPLSKDDALHEMRLLARIYKMIDCPSDVLGRVDGLLTQLDFSGKQIHDLFLVATMFAHGITHIYTYDALFEKIPGVTVLTP
ncbi:MAG: hypothetical protein CMI52_01740 [Parcubacteria group bacterium]|nr:hypothetical protein [Parcubacteria group bacterium]